MTVARQAGYTGLSAVAADKIILWAWNDVLPYYGALGTPEMPAEVALALAALIGGLVFKLTGPASQQENPNAI